jgi:predicted homoserine dehydrogenase-like protein
LTTKFDVDQLKSWGGVVDYVIGGQPSPGVFVLATTEDREQRHYLNMYKMGEGPLYCFYTPYHLAHLETPFSIARAVFFNDATSAPAGPPVVDVIATAKRDLRPGDRLDGAGGYTVYGQCENAGTVIAENLLPIGLSEDCEVLRDIARDQPVTYADVRLPAGRRCDQLRSEQNHYFQEISTHAMAVR